MIQYNRGKDRTVPYRYKLSTDPPRAGHTSSRVFLVAGTEQQRKTQPTGPGLEGELYLFKREWGVNRKASVSVLGLGAFGPRSIFFVVEKGGKGSKSMDINEPSLMDVAHDTINSTQGPALIEVAYFPSSEGKKRAELFLFNSRRVS